MGVMNLILHLYAIQTGIKKLVKHNIHETPKIIRWPKPFIFYLTKIVVAA